MLNETAIMVKMNDKTFGRNEAASIVGGLSRLNHLIDKGKIRSVKKKETQCAKVYCNAWDVLKYASLDRVPVGRPHKDSSDTL